MGRVAVGTTSTGQLRIGNHSPVEAAFTVEPQGTAAAGAEQDPVFRVTPSE
jgi:hypothetical protein